MGSRLVRGLALWEEDWLKKELEEMFKQSPLRKPFTSDLDITMCAIATDIKNGQQVTRTHKDNLINGLLDSCALPYGFRAAKSGGDSVIVDGGLCNNLPSDVLQQNFVPNDDGPIMGISFVRNTGSTPRNVLDFSASLLNAAIDTSMERAKAQLREACCELETSIDTFDFQKAFTLGISNDYERIPR